MSAAPGGDNLSNTSRRSNNRNVSNDTIEIDDIQGSINERDPESGKSTRNELQAQNMEFTVRDHCHRQRSEGVDTVARKKLIIASGLCLFFMICEIIGGALSNSLAIASDAAHLLADFASFIISLLAIWIAGRPSTQRMSFGFYRAEVIGALVSVAMIWVITVVLVYLAINRVINRDFEVEATIMAVTSGLAILVNLIMGLQLQHGHFHTSWMSGHSHNHGDAEKKKKRLNEKDNLKTTNLAHDIVESPATRSSLQLEQGADEIGELHEPDLPTFANQHSHSPGNMPDDAKPETIPAAHCHDKVTQDAMNLTVRAAFVHVIGDMIQSLGVFVAAMIIYFRPDWAIVDPICTFIFSAIVLTTTITIVKDAVLVLMEGTPRDLRYVEFLEIFTNIEGVKRVHNLRIWALSVNKVALSVHLAIDANHDPHHILEEASVAVNGRYHFFETTIQIEKFTPQMESCEQCELPKK